jgi:hypothetical protein
MPPSRLEGLRLLELCFNLARTVKLSRKWLPALKDFKRECGFRATCQAAKSGTRDAWTSISHVDWNQSQKGAIGRLKRYEGHRALIGNGTIMARKKEYDVLLTEGRQT